MRKRAGQGRKGKEGVRIWVIVGGGDEVKGGGGWADLIQILFLSSTVSKALQGLTRYPWAKIRPLPYAHRVIMFNQPLA